MLSFVKGIPIAKIQSADKSLDGKVIRINLDSDEKTNNIKNDMYDLLGEDEILKLAKRKRLSTEERNILENYIYGIEEYESEDEIKDKYGSLKTSYNNLNEKEIIINNGTLIPLPIVKKDQREIIYISAPSGSGKSTYTKMYALQYKEMFKKNRVILFSRLDKDKSLDEIKPIRIKLDRGIIEDPIKIEELKDSLVIFDDCDTIQDTELKNAIIKLKNDLLECGRHTNTYMIITSHLLMNYKETRTTLNEATMVVLFPKSGSSYHISRFFKTYAGLDNKSIQKAINLPSRWIALNKTYPQYIMYSSGVYILNK